MAVGGCTSTQTDVMERRVRFVTGVNLWPACSHLCQPRICSAGGSLVALQRFYLHCGSYLGKPMFFAGLCLPVMIVPSKTLKGINIRGKDFQKHGEQSQVQFPLQVSAYWGLHPESKMD